MRHRFIWAVVVWSLLVASCTSGAGEPSVTSARGADTTAGTTTTTAGPAAVPPEAQLANLMAFARLVNYVRFFHPSDEAADANWAEFTVAWVEQVEMADDPESLAALLNQSIQSVAPSARVFVTGDSTLNTAMPAVTGGGDQLVAWEHRGVNTAEVVGAISVYSSERVFVSSDEETWPEWFPDPDDVLDVDLGGGLSASVPLSVPVIDSAPVTAVPDAEWLESTSPLLTYDRYPVDERSTRLAAVILTWGFFEHFYPYWDVVDADWDAALQQALALAGNSADVPLVGVLRRLVAHTDDGHALVFAGSEDLAAPPIGWSWIEGELVITMATGTAVGAVQLGDIVVSIDGEPTIDVVAEAEELVAGATDEYRRLLALRGMLEGPWGSSIELALASVDGEVATVTLNRTAGRVWQALESERRPDAIELLSPTIAYVDLTRISEPDLAVGLDIIEGASRLVVDMRGYPTSAGWDLFPRLLSTVVSSDPFLVPITTRPDGIGRSYENLGWDLEPLEPRLADQIVFLTDERAISAAETLMGIAEAHHVGEIVGSHTAGTNGNVVQFMVPGGMTIAMTAMRVTNPDGTAHHGSGVQPTVLVNRTIQGVANEIDEVLERAIELLTESS